MSRKKKTLFSTQRTIALVAAVLLLLSPFYYGYVLRTVTSTWRWLTDIGANHHYRNYKSFNIRIPDLYSIHGIDVSSYQGYINWKKVKGMKEDSVHVSFAFIKATEGVFLVDPYFQRNWRECPKAGIPCGAYHFFRPKFNGKWQARFFLQAVKAQKGTLPMVVDIERLDGMKPAKMRQDLKDFLDEVTLKTQRKPIIYTGLQFYKDNLAGYFNDYTLWISSFDHPELAISTKINWQFWQHSEKARVNGIGWIVDFDVFRGDSTAFKKMLSR